MATNDDPFSDRSELVISLWTCICALPNYLRQVTIIVCNLQNISNLEIGQLKLDLMQLRHLTLQWYQQYRAHIQDTNFCPSRRLADSDKQLEALGLCFTCLIIMDRLIFALDTSAGASYEDEAQSLATSLVSIEQSALFINGRAEIFMALKMHVAETTRITAESWSKCKTTMKGSLRNWSSTIPKAVFTQWCQMTGWKTY